MPNFIGIDGSGSTKDWKGDLVAVGGRANRNEFRKGRSCPGHLHVFRRSRPSGRAMGHDRSDHHRQTGVTYRTSWIQAGWGSSPLDFWDDFSDDGKLEERPATRKKIRRWPRWPSKSSCRRTGPEQVTFLLTWHFPNRQTWTPKNNEQDRIGNYYTTKYSDAWDVATEFAPQLAELESKTVQFVRAFCHSNLPEVVKEAALFNLSTLRTQTCFRTEDGRFYGWEGCSNTRGCCHGSCTHVWNYEQATAFLSATLAKSMREVEFAHATDDQGLMSFRVNLPLERAQEFGKAAADGQMGCIMKMYRDWQLSGDDEMLKDPLAERQKGGGVLLDPRRLGRRPRRRHGGLPAQHDGRGVLRAESADGHLVSGCAAGRRGDGPLPSATTISPRPARTYSSRASKWIDAEPLQRRILRAQDPPAEG